MFNSSDIVGSLQENVVSTLFLRQVFNRSEVDGPLQVNGVSSEHRLGFLGLRGNRTGDSLRPRSSRTWAFGSCTSLTWLKGLSNVS